MKNKIEDNHPKINIEEKINHKVKAVKGSEVQSEATTIGSVKKNK